MLGILFCPTQAMPAKRLPNASVGGRANDVYRDLLVQKRIMHLVLQASSEPAANQTVIGDQLKINDSRYELPRAGKCVHFL